MPIPVSEILICTLFCPSASRGSTSHWIRNSPPFFIAWTAFLKRLRKISVSISGSPSISIFFFGKAVVIRIFPLSLSHSCRMKAKAPSWMIDQRSSLLMTAFGLVNTKSLETIRSSVVTPSMILRAIIFLGSSASRSLSKSVANPLMPPRGFLISCARTAAISPRTVSVRARSMSSSSAFCSERSLKTITYPFTSSPVPMKIGDMFTSTGVSFPLFVARSFSSRASDVHASGRMGHRSSSTSCSPKNSVHPIPIAS